MFRSLPPNNALFFIYHHWKVSGDISFHENLMLPFDYFFMDHETFYLLWKVHLKWMVIMEDKDGWKSHTSIQTLIALFEGG